MWTVCLPAGGDRGLWTELNSTDMSSRESQTSGRIGRDGTDHSALETALRLLAWAGAVVLASIVTAVVLGLLFGS